MHPNSTYRKPTDHTNLAFARERGFGVLCVSAGPVPLLAHIPFALAGDGLTADLHLVRSNPILRVLPAPVVIAVSGPDGYVSPDWYGIDDQVPTWNYVAVHLHGTLEPLPQTDLPDMLDRQSAVFENRLVPKIPWTTAKMTPEVRNKMMRQIVPCRLTIRDVHGTWKLNQNKPDAVRLRAAAAIPNGSGSELFSLAALMRDPPTD